MYKIAIIDDNEFDRNRTSDSIQNYCLDHKIETKNDIYESTLHFDFKKHYDVILLDIDMPNENGIDFAKRLNKEYKTKIIFITNHNSYMQSTFDVQPFHFIDKQDIEKSSVYVFDLLFTKLNEENKTIKAKTKKGDKYIALSEIYYITSDGHECLVHTVDDTFSTWDSIKALSEQYKTHSFILINQSTLINMKHIQEIYTDYVIMPNNQKFPISTRAKTFVRQTYESYIMRNM